MAPRRIHMDLPVQFAFMVYAYATLRMLLLPYDLFERYFEHHKWCPLYMDTDSYYIALAETSLHDAIRPEMKESFYNEYDQWLPSLACEAHRELFIHTAVNYSLGAWYPMQQFCDDRHIYEQRQPGLFKTEFVGTKMIALSSKACHCMDDVSSKEKLSSKGLQKDKNTSHIEMVSAWFTRKSHHMDSPIIYLAQNVFDKSPHHRTISLNSTQIVLFQTREMGARYHIWIDKCFLPAGVY